MIEKTEDDYEDSNDDLIKNENISNEDDVEQESEIIINDEDDDINIVIEVDDDLIFDENPVQEDLLLEEDSTDNIILSKHKIQGKHSLKYDSIFKGKKEDPVLDEEMDSTSHYYNDKIEVDKSSNYYFESIDNEDYVRTKQVKDNVYKVLSDHTGINFMNNRRKPSKVDFNHYYFLLKTHLKDESFTNIELFNELSIYFSDNLFNMFKLLDNKWRNMIITELQSHIGKNQNSREIKNRNIYEGTELEFEWIDVITNELKLITGVVVGVDYHNSIFQVDSYENIYDVDISMITEILNNTKFKYNLNKLNNIDFL